MPPKLGKQIDTRDIRQAPIEDDDVSLGGHIERPEKRFPVGKAADSKTMIRQRLTDNIAVVLVVFDPEEAYETRFLLLVGTAPILHRYEEHGWGKLVSVARPPAPFFAERTAPGTSLYARTVQIPMWRGRLSSSPCAEVRELQKLA